MDVRQLRAIIHGLKMSGLSFVDADALDAIKQRIKFLPSPEELNSISGNPESIKKVAKEIGEIIKLIEVYGKRGVEKKVREKSMKNLPPRYQVLEWRDNMENKANVVKVMVRTSSVLDEKGNAELSKVFLKCANNIMDETITEKQLTDAIERLGKSGYTEEQLQVVAQLVNAPVNPAGVAGAAGDVGKAAWEGVKNIGKSVSDWFGKKVQTGKDIFRSGLWRRRLDSTIQQVGEIIKELTTADVQAVDPQSKQTIKAILDKHQAAYDALRGAASMASATQQAAPTGGAPTGGAPAGGAQAQQAAPAGGAQAATGGEPTWASEALKAGWTPPVGG